MGPWMLACEWIITSERRRLVAGVQLNRTSRILPPTRRTRQREIVGGKRQSP